MSRSFRSLGWILACFAVGAVHEVAAAQTTPIGPVPVCAPCLTSHFKAFNRCTWWSIDTDGVNCAGVEVGGLFRVDSPTKRVDVRFTLSPALTGSQTMTSVWLYYRTRGVWPNPDWTLVVYGDSNGQPDTSAVLNTTSFQPIQPTGTKDWQNITLSSAITGLTPGAVYHLVIQPPSTATTTKYIEVVTARGRFPVRFTPTDALGTSVTSPCDRWLGLMRADSSVGPVVGSLYYLLEADNNVGYTPIFAVELENVGLFGQPYNQHIERTIVGGNEYGQRIQLAATTRVNYAGFFLRGEGCPGASTPQALEFRLLDSTQTDVITPVTIPATQYYFARSHWFGVFFDALDLPAGTYYLTLRASNSSQPGWVFSVENSTMPVSASAVPTYERDNAYAVENTGSGGSFVAISTKSDAGFNLGYFASGPQEIGNLCDSGVWTTACTTKYAKVAQPGDTLVFGGSNLNIGGVAPPSGNLQYARLLDFDCTPLTSAVLCTTAVGPGKHASGPDIQWTWPTGSTGDLFLWWELGHQDPLNTANLITDELEPIEIRNLCSACTCLP